LKTHLNRSEINLTKRSSNQLPFFFLLSSFFYSVKWASDVVIERIGAHVRSALSSLDICYNECYVINDPDSLDPCYSYCLKYSRLDSTKLTKDLIYATLIFSWGFCNILLVALSRSRNSCQKTKNIPVSSLHILSYKILVS